MEKAKEKRSGLKQDRSYTPGKTGSNSAVITKIIDKWHQRNRRYLYTGNLRGGEHRRAGDGGGGPEENTNVRDNLQRKTIKKINHENTLSHQC